MYKIYENLLNKTLKNRYIFLGLLTQRATPILLAAPLIFFYTERVYAEFLFLISIAQLIASIGSIGTNQVVIPLWTRYQNKARMILSGILVILIGHILIALVMSMIFTIPYFKFSQSINILENFFVIWLYSFSWALMNTMIAFARARGILKEYFYSGLLNILVCILLLLFFIYSSWLSLDTLFIIFISGMQAVIFTLLIYEIKNWNSQIKVPNTESIIYIIKSGIPMILHGITVTFLLLADKFVARSYFSEEFFTTFIIEFQMAYSVLIVPTAVAFYSASKFAEFTESKERIMMETLLKNSMIMSILGSILLIFIIYLYCSLVGINLGINFLLISLTLITHGIYMQFSNYYAADLQFTKILISSFIGCFMFICIAFISVYTNLPILLNICWLGYSAGTIYLRFYPNLKNSER